MKKCSSCDGLIPSMSKSCPNCHKISRRIKAGLGAAGVGVISLTLMACYGAPPDYKRAHHPRECDNGSGEEECPTHTKEKHLERE